MTRVDFGAVALVDDLGSRFEAIVRARLMGRNKSLGNTVVVGDRAQCAREGERWIVEDVAPRRNAFSRRASGERPME